MFIPTVRLLRVEENQDYGTFGVLIVNSEVFCVTLEPKDMENASNISSIPAQQYMCKLLSTNLSSVTKLGWDKAYQIMDVPDRTNVKIHPGNSIDDTLGCVLTAQYFGKLKTGQRAVLNSGATWLSFMQLMNGYSAFHLTIKEEF